MAKTFNENISDNNNSRWRVCHLFWLLTVLTFTTKFNAAKQDVLPLLCDDVKCPGLTEMQCPDDSDIRESLSTVGFLQLSTVASANRTTDDSVPSTSVSAATAAAAAQDNATSDVSEEVFSQCCLTKKCVCRTCFIPDCHEPDDVVVELQPESMDTPGQCCGKYECMPEPNCTDVRDTEYYWLRDCQRCKCFSGQHICHYSCDEAIAKKPTGICNSKNLNTFFEHGASWKDGCYECECINGEEKCVMPFCRSVNCPPQRQVILKDSCCPICWPKGIPMPNIDDDYDGGYDNDKDNETEDRPRIDMHNYDSDDDEYDDISLPPLPTLKPNVTSGLAEEINATATTTTTTIATTITTTAANIESTTVAATPAPCKDVGTYKEYTEVVEVVRQSTRNDFFYYTVIGALSAVIFMLIAWIIQLRAKQRSYRPVSIDDNFNKMSTNIKKMNEYA